jgi:hypothetical protein
MTTFNFPPTSRYFGIDLATLETVNGDKIVYLRRRFIPSPERFSLLQEHIVSEGERPDLVTAHYMGDAEAFWRIADANAVMRPEELTEAVGKRIRITLPEGIPGAPDA